MNQRDSEGWSALHYASKLGYLYFTRLFIAYGASTTIKNNEKQSPLHVAAKYGHYCCCMELIGSNDGKNYINEKDYNGSFNSTILLFFFLSASYNLIVFAFET